MRHTQLILMQNQNRIGNNRLIITITKTTNISYIKTSNFSKPKGNKEKKTCTTITLTPFPIYRIINDLRICWYCKERFTHTNTFHTDLHATIGANSIHIQLNSITYFYSFISIQAVFSFLLKFVFFSCCFVCCIFHFLFSM